MTVQNTGVTKLRRSFPAAALASLASLLVLASTPLPTLAHPKAHVRLSGKEKQHLQNSLATRKWIRSIPSKKTAYLTLLAGSVTVAGGMNFNGYSHGQMTVVIPLGWTVHVLFKNVGDLPHSAVIEPWSENVNSPTPRPAFPGAQTPNPVDGTPPGKSATFVFRALHPGKYRLMCAVPGHAAMGMWDVVDIVAGQKTASIQV
jgi:sulfocyanin